VNKSSLTLFQRLTTIKGHKTQDVIKELLRHSDTIMVTYPPWHI